LNQPSQVTVLFIKGLAILTPDPKLRAGVLFNSYMFTSTIHLARRIKVLFINTLHLLFISTVHLTRVDHFFPRPELDGEQGSDGDPHPQHNQGISTYTQLSTQTPQGVDTRSST
jgi:hypothetical protein